MRRGRTDGGDVVVLVVGRLERVQLERVEQQLDELLELELLLELRLFGRRRKQQLFELVELVVTPLAGRAAPAWDRRGDGSR